MTQISQFVTEPTLDRRGGGQSWRALSMLCSDSFIIWRLRRLAFAEHFTNATRAMHCALRVRCHSERAGGGRARNPVPTQRVSFLPQCSPNENHGSRNQGMTAAA
jgi:hypothetical protein